MKALKVGLIVLLLAAGFAAGYGYGRWYGPKAGGAESAKMINGRKVLYWQDGMHPWIKSDHPGKCPICHMDLDPVFEDEAGATAAPENQGKILYYTDPEDRNYKADAPGLNPETGNDLVPVYENSPESMPPGTVHVSTEQQQLIGVVLGKPEYTDEHESVRAAGKVTLDERRVSRVTPKINGWIEKVHADFTGDLVKKGQPLVTIYSPDLLASQREYLLALRAEETLAGSSLSEARLHRGAMAEAAKRRLQLLDVTPEQIAELERTKEPVKSVTVYAPSTGYVMERNAFPNQRTTPDQSLYTLADLSRVWVMAEVFEYEAPNIRPGQTVTLSFPYAPERTIRGRVAYIQPGLDPSTRTLEVRIEVPNPGFQLKPDMYLDVIFDQRGGRMLTVPATAVLETGLRNIVFIHRGNGFMEPRDVKTGLRFGDRVQILEGLNANDEIVVSGNFLIDSESQLRGAARQQEPSGASKNGTGGAGAAGSVPGPHSAHNHGAHP